MIKKVLLAILLVIGITPVAKGMNFRPSLSLLWNYTSTKNYTNIDAGVFDIENRKINFGFELTHKFYLHRNIFIKSGLRFSSYQTSFYGKNQVAALSDGSYPFLWKRNYESYTIPLHFGKDFATDNGNKGDLYMGVSAGLFNPTRFESRGSTGIPKDPNYNINISASSWDDVTEAAPSFFSTLDIGANYQLFKSAPRFSMGILCSIQLNKTEPYAFHGTVQDMNTGEVYQYEMQHHQSIINYAVSFNYNFGKARPVYKKNNQLDCPQ